MLRAESAAVSAARAGVTASPVDELRALSGMLLLENVGWSARAVARLKARASEPGADDLQRIVLYTLRRSG
jgi:hypothetical protein